MRKFIFVFLLACTAISCSTRQKSGATYVPKDFFCVAFYNVENLFDTINQPGVIDEDFTPTGRNRWTAERYRHKLEQISSVISQINNGSAPDIVGLSEVENRSVLEDLVRQVDLKKAQYSIVHYDSPDRRGIDCALLYNSRLFRLEKSFVRPVKVPGEPEFHTRDILVVEGIYRGERLHFMVAHWPSRYGGEQRSLPNRMAAAKTMRSISDSIIASRSDAKIIMMGDFNDDPISPSVQKGLRARSLLTEQAYAGDLYSPMFNLYKAGYGTLAYRDAWNLFDIMVVNKNLLFPTASTNGRGLQLYQHPKTGFGAFIYSPKHLKQPSGAYKGYPYRSFAAGVYHGGYSDHFPVYLYLRK